MDEASYRSELRQLQIALVHIQRHMIDTGQSAIIVFEGRDSAGKGGTIRRIVEHAAPRQTRVIALDKPSDREKRSWYFQRYVTHMPAAGEIVLFDRSWYNRAGVEYVMDFCTPDQRESFFDMVPSFEGMVVSAGAHLIKYYLDISREEQAKRLQSRRTNPLKSWKISAIDEAALERYDEYTEARDIMLQRTSLPHAPWHVVKADNKMTARIHVMRDLVRRLPRPEDMPETKHPEPGVLTEFAPALLKTAHLAR
ncbi:polyphosphate kinase 2 [Maricaulis sp.]|uniref:polyphosphate kinase 2 n=1 Tax=Maricaulis sp. TaxID=1486257 RepID=UPI00262B0925|nr:polyphosphate kinase 2 [Maricaulis sp.]